MKIKNLNTFQKQIATLFKGSFWGQIIGFIGSFILAKQYGTEAYGMFAIFTSTMVFVSILNTFQLEYIIVPSKTKVESLKKTNQVFNICFYVTFLIGIAVISILFFKKNILTQKVSILFIAVIASLFFSFNKILEAQLTFLKKFHILSFIRLLQPLLNLLFQGVLYFKFNLYGLVIGNLLTIIVLFFIFKKNSANTLKLLRPTFYKEVFTTYKNIITKLFPATILNSIAITLIPLLISDIFSIAEFGVYFLSLRLLSVPLSLITNTVTQVYYKTANVLYHSKPNKLYTLTKKTILTNLIIICCLLILINTVGIFLIELFFDSSWKYLRTFTILSSFLFIGKVIHNPISDILIILNKNHRSLLLSIYLFLTNLIAIYIGYTTNNIFYTIGIISFIGGIAYFINVFFILKTLKAHVQNKRIES